MVFLRKAIKDDIDLLFRWANDPVVRSNSFNTDMIPYDNHVMWFNKIIEDPSVLQFILMDDDIPVGQIRLNIDDDEAEIGYSIGSEFRGKGYGHWILRLITEEVKANHPEIKCFIAKVKPDNMASNTLFIKEGYSMDYSCYSMRIDH